MTYEYAAEVIRVVDGDTLDLSVDLGFRLTYKIRARLLGYNAPELHETDLGLKAKIALSNLVGTGRVEIRTEKGDSFGRWLVEVQLQDRSDVVTRLIASGHGAAWDGRGKAPTPWRTETGCPKPQLMEDPSVK